MKFESNAPEKEPQKEPQEEAFGQEEEESVKNAEEETKETSPDEVLSPMEMMKKLEEKEERIKDLEEQIKKEQEESLQYCDALKRLQAEFSNYQKRMNREKEKSIKFANKEFAFDLLQVVDNLERALSSKNGDEEDCEIYRGVELVLKQMKDVLRKNAIEEENPLYEPFNVDFHEVVLKEESEYETDTVIEVLQKGYKIHGKLLRPAMVKVSK